MGLGFLSRGWRLYFSPNQFLGEVLSTQNLRNHRKIGRISILTRVVRECLYPSRIEFRACPLQHRQERHAKQPRPHGIPLLYPTGAVDVAPFSRLHLEEHRRVHLAVTFCHELCKRRHGRGCLCKHSRPLHCVECVGAIGEDQPVFCLVMYLARSATRSNPPRTPTPNCLALRLTSSSRGRHYRMVPVAIRRLHVTPTHTGRRRQCHWIARKASRV